MYVYLNNHNSKLVLISFRPDLIYLTVGTKMHVTPSLVLYFLSVPLKLFKSLQLYICSSIFNTETLSTYRHDKSIINALIQAHVSYNSRNICS